MIVKDVFQICCNGACIIVERKGSFTRHTYNLPYLAKVPEINDRVIYMCDVKGDNNGIYLYTTNES